MTAMTTENARALIESRASQKRYTALARWHRDQGYDALQHSDLEGAGHHFLAAHQMGVLAIIEKVREPRVRGDG